MSHPQHDPDNQDRKIRLARHGTFTARSSVFTGAAGILNTADVSVDLHGAHDAGDSDLQATGGVGFLSAQKRITHIFQNLENSDNSAKTQNTTPPPPAPQPVSQLRSIPQSTPSRSSSPSNTYSTIVATSSVSSDGSNSPDSRNTTNPKLNSSSANSSSTITEKNNDSHNDRSVSQALSPPPPPPPPPIPHSGMGTSSSPLRHKRIFRHRFAELPTIVSGTRPIIRTGVAFFTVADPTARSTLGCTGTGVEIDAAEYVDSLHDTITSLKEDVARLRTQLSTSKEKSSSENLEHEKQPKKKQQALPRAGTIRLSSRSKRSEEKASSEATTVNNDTPTAAGNPPWKQANTTSKTPLPRAKTNVFSSRTQLTPLSTDQPIPSRKASAPISGSKTIRAEVPSATSSAAPPSSTLISFPVGFGYNPQSQPKTGASSGAGAAAGHRPVPPSTKPPASQTGKIQRPSGTPRLSSDGESPSNPLATRSRQPVPRAGTVIGTGKATVSSKSVLAATTNTGNAANNPSVSNPVLPLGGDRGNTRISTVSAPVPGTRAKSGLAAAPADRSSAPMPTNTRRTRIPQGSSTRAKSSTNVVLRGSKGDSNATKRTWTGSDRAMALNRDTFEVPTASQLSPQETETSAAATSAEKSKSKRRSRGVKGMLGLR